ncbi:MULTISPECIES: hypothetical protein [unclassified Sinorhizobium]|uniref:hypothetical protein n=1 Tax=unclassified Sinorhizobium TaxID=2613772 RepID=UPI0024C2E344|nr:MULTISPECIES: hypothetical protein [unclassified Sinorhizobium]MDK1376776.1 hypothetical protein [Sinorhizobium sp. 6-70]MDK1479548.1 hypothetical protein [Sinorhizobium sp. 6-117]
MAIQQKTGEVCLLHAVMARADPELLKLEVKTTGPIWGSGKADDPRHAAMRFYETLLEAGHLSFEVTSEVGFDE